MPFPPPLTLIIKCHWLISYVQLLSNCPNVGEEGFVALGTHCTALRDLQLEDCPGVTDGMLKAIAQHNSVIRSLRMSPASAYLDSMGIARVTDEGIGAFVLARKDLLKRISLTEGVTDRGVRLVVENCPRLKQLGMWSSLITDEGCQPIMQLRFLRKLEIGPSMKRKLHRPSLE